MTNSVAVRPRAIRTLVLSPLADNSIRSRIDMGIGIRFIIGTVIVFLLVAVGMAALLTGGFQHPFDDSGPSNVTPGSIMAPAPKTSGFTSHRY
jgi:hypothetical protein